MKQQISLVILFFSFITLHAQTAKRDIGAYAITTAEIAVFNNQTALSIGGYGGVLIQKSWFIGLGGSNLLFKKNVNNTPTRFQFNQYGVYVEKHFFKPGGVQLTTGLMAGPGWLNYIEKQPTKKLKMDGNYTYVIQPKLAVTVPVFKFAKVQLHGSYRFTGNIDSELYSTSNMNGVNAGLSFLFGSF